MIHAGFIGQTTSHAVTGTVGTFTVPDADPKKFKYLISSDVDIAIDRLAVASATDSFRIPAGKVAEVMCFGGEEISYIRIGTTSGTIWITQVE